MSRVRRIKSFDTFSEQLQRQSPGFIAVRADLNPTRGILGATKTAAIGNLDHYKHSLVYAVSCSGNYRKYVEPIFTAFQSEYGMGDYEKRNLRMTELLLAGEVRVELLRETLPETDVILVGANPIKPMLQEDMKLVHMQAKQYGIETPDFEV